MSALKKMSFSVCAVVGVVVEIVLTLLILIPVAVLMNKQLLGEEIAAVLPMVAAGVSVYAAVSILAKMRKKQILAMGAVLAALYWVFAALLCGLGGSRCEFGYWLLWLGAAVFVGGFLSAVMSAGSKSKRKGHRTRK